MTLFPLVSVTDASIGVVGDAKLRHQCLVDNLRAQKVVALLLGNMVKTKHLTSRRVKLNEIDIHATCNIMVETVAYTINARSSHGPEKNLSRLRSNMIIYHSGTSKLIYGGNAQ